MSKVQIDGAVFSVEEILRAPARYADVLEQALLTKGYAVCMCRLARPPLKLAIKHYRSALHLAPWPNDGHRHSPDCPFQRIAVRHSYHSASTGLDSGDNRNRKIDSSQTSVETSMNTGSRSHPKLKHARRLAGLLSYLHSAWSEAGLDKEAVPKRPRDWRACHDALSRVTTTRSLGGLSAYGLVHIIDDHLNDDEESGNNGLEQFLAGLGFKDGSIRRGLLVGELTSIRKSANGHVVQLGRSPRPFYASAELVREARTMFQHAWQAIGDPTFHVVAIAVVTEGEPHITITEIAAMRCSSNFARLDYTPATP